MGFWASFYSLKSVAKPSDVWNCIKNTFSDMNFKETLPFEMPNHFCLISERDYFYWDCAPCDDGIVKFKFSGILAEKEISLLIIFAKNKTRPCKKSEEIHQLAYREKTEGNLFFWRRFFQELKKHIPNKYTTVNVISEQYGKKDPWSKGYITMREVKKIPIRFLSDDKGKRLFVSNEWIEKLRGDLWPFNVEFWKCTDGHAFDGNRLLFEFEKALCETFESTRAMLRINQSKGLPMNPSEDFCPDDQSRIIVGSEGIYETDEIREKGYEALLSAIIDKVEGDRWFCDDKQVYDMFGEHVENEEDKRVQEQVVLYIRENGLDKTQIQKDRELIEKQKEEIARLESEIEKLSASERSNAGEKQQMCCVDNSASLDKKVKKEETLERRIKKLKKENGDLKKDNKKMHDRYSDLEGQYTKKQNEENTGGYHLDIPCSEKNLFPNEIEDYLYMLLYSKIEKERQDLPENKKDEKWRKRDVLKKLVDEKKFKEEETVSYKKRQQIESILKGSKQLTKEQIGKLEDEGFRKNSETNDHLKLRFFDDRYQMAFSTTQIDERAIMNKIGDIKRSFFLIK